MSFINYFEKLSGITNIEKYDTGEIESVNINKKNTIIINNNTYIPRYSDYDTRRKELPSISFYKSGKIKSIDIDKQSQIKAYDYSFEAEKVIFYDDGNIKKIFPLNGKISAYWSEEEEYELSKKYKINLEFATINNKIISIKFYKSGKIKSITLWPNERVNVKYKDKIIRCRIGISMFEDGKIMTCEPATPFEISTPIGNIEAFNKNPIAITGDSNSLKFDNKGNVVGLVTSTNIIKIVDMDGKTIIHSPRNELLFAGSEEEELIPLKVAFTEEAVIIDEKYKYELNKYNFFVYMYGEKTLFL